MTSRFARLHSAHSIVGSTGGPAIAFQVYWQQFCEGLEQALTDIEAVNEAQQSAIEAIQAAQAAADAANDAAAVANTAAVDAQAAAVGAQVAADDAAGAAVSANAAIAEIEAGDFDIAAITVGGQRFINDGGTLALEL